MKNQWFAQGGPIGGPLWFLLKKQTKTNGFHGKNDEKPMVFIGKKVKKPMVCIRGSVGGPLWFLLKENQWFSQKKQRKTKGFHRKNNEKPMVCIGGPPMVFIAKTKRNQWSPLGGKTMRNRQLTNVLPQRKPMKTSTIRFETMKPVIKASTIASSKSKTSSTSHACIPQTYLAGVGRGSSSSLSQGRAAHCTLRPVKPQEAPMESSTAQCHWT